jgi:hypothetical protein
MSEPMIFDKAYPEALRKAEDDLVARRRASSGLAEGTPKVGVGLSGGGIRSATFCLGIFQALAARTGLLRRIDFVSTVSGGGYFGSFFGRLLSRDFVKTAEDAERILREDDKPQIVRYLRENGRYLAPNGAGDALLAGAVVIRNLVAVQLVLAVFVTTLFLALQVVRGSLAPVLAQRWPWLGSLATGDILWWSPWILVAPVVFVVIAFPLGWAYWLIEPRRQAAAKDRGDQSDIPPWTAVALVLVTSLLLTVANLGEPFRFWAPWAFLLLGSVLTLFFWRLAVWIPFPEELGRRFERPEGGQEGEEIDLDLYQHFALRNRLSLWLTWALTATAAFLIFGLIDSFGQTFYCVLLHGTGNVVALLASIVSTLMVGSGLAQRVAALAPKDPAAPRAKLPLATVAGAAALLLAFLLLVTLDAASHAVAWNLYRPASAPSGLMPQKPSDQWKTELPSSGKGQTLRVTVAMGEPPKPEGTKVPVRPERDLLVTLAGFAIGFFFSVLLGQTWPFINRSSQASFYSTRLTRAYLGASNPGRWRDGQSVSEVLRDDDYDLARYWPPPTHNAAPLHLINVTINETVDGRSQVQQQDRKGVGMTLGPCGLSAGVEHHAVVPLGNPGTDLDPAGLAVRIYPEADATDPDKPYRVFEYPFDGAKPVYTGEELSLGTWVGISGAAFTTGLGMGTSLGLSFFAGLFNVRIGRWWDAGIDVAQRKQTRAKLGVRAERWLARLFPVQVLFVDELLARFHGTARRQWYLSDGGHFENMGGYELVRRRLPLIVILDGEQDEGYTFGGLANLVRKARLDLGAEITFLNEEELDRTVQGPARQILGTLQQMRRGTWETDPPQQDKGPRGTLKAADVAGRSLVHAALARVTYRSPETAPSYLLYVKPTLTLDEPVDLAQYHRAHPNFPHEPTLDQFFDESQWESYRRLGHHIASLLFGSDEAPVDAWWEALFKKEA